MSAVLASLRDLPMAHVALEWLGYAVGATLYRRARRRAPLPVPAADQALLLGCLLAGAAVGSTALHALQFGRWVVGKTLLGGLLGATLGTELGKRLVGLRVPTGDAFVWPLAVGIALGRLGCQWAGAWDTTYGSPTGLGFGWDYGDQVLRWPTAAMESVAVLLLGWWAPSRRIAPPGEAYNRFLLGYCALRAGLEFLKPPFGAAIGVAIVPVRLAGLTPIQWAALAGAGWFAVRLLRSPTRVESS